MIQPVIGVGHSGRRGNGCDLADADGAAGDGQARLLHHDGLDLRDLVGAEEPQGAELGRGLAVHQGVLLREGEAQGHDHAALDLAFAGDGVHGLAHVVGGHHLLELAVLAENADLGGIAIGHVGHGVGHRRAQGIGLGQVFGVELPALQILEGLALQGGLQVHAGAAAGLAGDGGLSRAGGGAGVGGFKGIGADVDHLIPGQPHDGAHDLHQHRAKTLADAAGAGIDDHLAVLDLQPHPAGVGQTHAHAGVLHGAGNAGKLGIFVLLLHGHQRLHQAGGVIHDLAVGQRLAGTDGVAHADLPGGDADLVGHFIQQALHGKAGLGDAEAPEGAGRRVVGVVRPAVTLEVFIVVRPRGVGAGALENGAAQGGVGAGVGDDLHGHALDVALVVAAHGDLNVHGVALGMDQNALGAGELHLHRSAGEVGNQGRVVLHGHILLAAEAAAHQHVLYLHLFHGKAEHGRRLVLGVVGALVGGEDHHAVAIHVGHGALRL